MPIRSLSTIITDAINFIKSKRPNIATFVGSVTRDVVIESPAQEFDKVYQELSHTQKVQTVKYASELTSDELDALANNYGLTRLQGKVSSGLVTFQVRNFSPSSSNITIPLNTVIGTTGTQTTPQITFITRQVGTFIASQAPSYFNPVTGLYEVTVSIAAQQVGSIGNVAAGTIVNLLSTVSGVDAVTNTVATTGGEDIESNVDFGSRIRIKLTGNNVGTATGIESLVRENANVSDAIIVTPNDAEMLRSEFGGEVDVYVIGEVLSTTSEIRLYTTSGSQSFILQHQPARSIASITGVSGGAPYTFIPGIDFNFVLDTNQLLSGSTKMKNNVTFNIGGTNPDSGSNITITYVYNSLIETLQLQLDKDDTHIVTSDILIKEAVEADVDVTADVTLFPGFISADVITNIQTTLTNSINALGLGDSIDRSDVIGIIESVEGVDQVNVNTLVLSKNGTPLPNTQQRLEIQKLEYPKLTSATINII
jgi:uncharacterized phage protein gp47/JayE